MDIPEDQSYQAMFGRCTSVSKQTQILLADILSIAVRPRWCIISFIQSLIMLFADSIHFPGNLDHDPLDLKQLDEYLGNDDKNSEM